MTFAYVHAGLMSIGFLLLFFGFVLARYMKRKRWWLKVHRVFGVSGASLTLLGFFIVVLRIYLAGRPHFTIAHAYVGLVIVILALMIPVLGFMQFKIREVSGKIRPIHRFSGWLILILMMINIVLGMHAAGITN